MHLVVPLFEVKLECCLYRVSDFDELLLVELLDAFKLLPALLGLCQCVFVAEIFEVLELLLQDEPAEVGELLVFEVSDVVSTAKTGTTDVIVFEDLPQSHEELTHGGVVEVLVEWFAHFPVLAKVVQCFILSLLAGVHSLEEGVEINLLVVFL